MVLKPDQERVKILLRDTITLLCKNGLSFKSKFSIDAVIGVTLDDDDVFLVSMNESVKSDVAPGALLGRDGQVLDNIENAAHRRKRRKRKRSKTSKTEQEDASTHEDGGSISSGDDVLEASDDEDREENDASPPHKAAKPDDQKDKSSDVCVKEEVEDNNWGPKDSLPDFSTASFSQSDADPSFPTLPGLLGETGGWVPGIGPPPPQFATLVRRTATTTVPPPPLPPPPPPPPPAQPQPAQPQREGATTDGDITLNTTDTTNVNKSQMSVGDQGQSFPCLICGKSFSRRYSWKMHMNLHQGRYNIYCHLCNKGFNNSYTLKGHMSNVHTGIKDFKCPICGKEFGYKHHLKSHMTRSHRECAQNPLDIDPSLVGHGLNSDQSDKQFEDDDEMN